MFYFLPEYLKWWKEYQQTQEEDKTVPFGIS